MGKNFFFLNRDGEDYQVVWNLYILEIQGGHLNKVVYDWFYVEKLFISVSDPFHLIRIRGKYHLIYLFSIKKIFLQKNDLSCHF